MPIAGTYSWSEKNDRVVLYIPLKGCSPAKVDIFCTSSTLKVNYSPYILDLVLRGPINAVKHKATVKEGVLTVTLFKSGSEGLWGTLLASDEDSAALRAKSVADHQNLQKELSEQRRDRRVDDERFSLRKQMALDDSEKSRLENLKSEEKAAAEEVMYKTFADMQAQQAATAAGTSGVEAHLKVKQPNSATTAAASSSAASKTIFDKFLDMDDIDDEPVTEGKNNNSPRVVELHSSDDEDEDEEDEDRVMQRNNVEISNISESQFVCPDDDKEVRFVPPPRSIKSNDSDTSSRLGVSFTPRLFPTPMRESKIAEEEDWIVKNRRHLKNHPNFGKRLGDVSEEDPTWLKAKGDDFFRGGDARSAISAYSAAIDADESLTSCYANRSACYLKLGLFSDCRADCSKAIEQLDANAEAAGGDGSLHKQAVSALAAQSRSTLFKLLLRRSVAACNLGDFASAISDQSRVLAAVESLHCLGIETGGLNPATVMEDLRRLRVLVEADTSKKEGDAAFAESRLEEARAKYDAALELLPFHVGSLSNRSACRLAQNDLQGCIDDCSKALELLELDPLGTGSTNLANTGGNAGGINMLASVLPPAGSAKRLSWVTRTVTRRGQAHWKLGQTTEALRDYTQAAALNPNDAALQADLKAVQAAAETIKEAK